MTSIDNSNNAHDPLALYYVLLHQNSRQNLLVTFNKKNSSEEECNKREYVFQKTIEYTKIAALQDNENSPNKLIYIGETYEHTPKKIECYLTFFNLPGTLLTELSKHTNKGTIRYIQFCIGKQWMEQGKTIQISVLNGLPNIDDMATVNTIGKPATYCSKTYDLQNPEW